MAKLADMSLEELYARKVTSTVEEVILKKEDFSKHSSKWCECVCKLKCKSPSTITPTYEHVDILIIQDHRALPDTRFGRSSRDIESKYNGVIRHIMSELDPGRTLTYRVTDMLRCPLEPVDIVKGKAPSDVVLRKCRPYLHNEIAVTKPKVIVSLATSVSKALVEGKTNYANRGDIVEYEGIPLVLTLHHRITTMLRQNSVGAFYGPDFYEVIKRDIGKAVKLVRGELKIPNLDAAIEQAKKRIFVARSIEGVKSLVEDLLKTGESTILSYDLETNGLDPHAADAKILTAQFGYRHGDDFFAIVFPLWHMENKWYDPEEAWVHIRKLLENPDIGKIGHNMKFDVLFTWFTQKTKVVNVVLDTMLMLHTLNTGLQGMYGLKQAVVDWLPHTELGGYEEKLPKLTKPRKQGEEQEEEVEADI